MEEQRYGFGADLGACDYGEEFAAIHPALQLCRASDELQGYGPKVAAGIDSRLCALLL